MTNFFIGIDIGSSSVKTTVFDAVKGESVGKATYPEQEQTIESPHTGWAEQDPNMWWENFLKGYDQIISEYRINPDQIAGIGISYQMHGLVAVDKELNPVRKSIIWCDSRAVDIGDTAFNELGTDYCLKHLLNSPGNFTASKLKWVKEHEPQVYERICKVMLPGDYIALRLTGTINTTRSGLSEGVFWDFKNNGISEELLTYYEIDKSLIPELVPNMGEQSQISSEIASRLGLNPNVKVFYRAGDQPNNAFSLNVLDPGQIATTAGTSGVIYAVTDKDISDDESRINTFLHVNDMPGHKRNGILICVNGTGILYSWLRKLLGNGSAEFSYSEMNSRAALSPAGSEGILFYPFGNGAERILNNKVYNANIFGLDFNRHQPEHVIRTGMEGIIYAMNLGFDILKSNRVTYDVIRAGNANLFLSETFRSIFANLTNTAVEIYDTDGADGAARGAAIASGFYTSPEQAFENMKRIDVTEPQKELTEQYREYYLNWKEKLKDLIPAQSKN